jgi:hypothetical protein
MTIRRFPLGAEPSEDLSEFTTPEERLVILAELSSRMWELTGRTIPLYSRSQLPVSIVRRP